MYISFSLFASLTFLSLYPLLKRKLNQIKTLKRKWLEVKYLTLSVSMLCKRLQISNKHNNWEFNSQLLEVFSHFCGYLGTHSHFVAIICGSFLLNKLQQQRNLIKLYFSSILFLFTAIRVCMVGGWCCSELWAFLRMWKKERKRKQQKIRNFNQYCWKMLQSLRDEEEG